MTDRQGEVVGITLNQYPHIRTGMEAYTTVAMIRDFLKNIVVGLSVHIQNSGYRVSYSLNGGRKYGKIIPAKKWKTVQLATNLWDLRPPWIKKLGSRPKDPTRTIRTYGTTIYGTTFFKVSMWYKFVPVIYVNVDNVIINK